MLFLLYYDVLLRKALSRHPHAHVYVFVDDIAVRVAEQAGLLDLINRLYQVAYPVGLRFNADNTETCQHPEQRPCKVISSRYGRLSSLTWVMCYVAHRKRTTCGTW